MSCQLLHRRDARRVFLLTAAALLPGCVKPAALCAQPYAPGQAYYDRSNYIKYIAGDMPVIFSAPHGGELTPAEIPDRIDNGTDPDFTTITDENTQQVAEAIQTVFCKYYGHAPHVIICQLKRTKIDCNRSLYQGVYDSNVYATIAWNDFQNWIGVGSNAAVQQAGYGFYIDVHGQAHTIQRLELGYLLTADQLTNTDEIIDEPGYAWQSSIRTLAGIVNGKLSMPFSEILRGPNSFGGLMNGFGFPSVPDPVMPNPGNGTNPIVYPGDENPYFDGGFNTATFSSVGGGPVDGVQIEANFTNVRDTPADWTNYATALARTVDFFFTNYYGFNLRICGPSIWTAGAGALTNAANWSNGITPVSGNYLLFAGLGGAVSNNLSSFSGTNQAWSVLFGTNAGPYTLYGNSINLAAGVTNYAAHSQVISNAITLTSPQTFCSVGGGMTFGGGLANAGNNLTVNSTTNVTFTSPISGAGGLVLAGGTLTLNAASSYSGGTTDEAGLLIVNSTNGCANGIGPLNINPGATLAGGGTVSGPVSISGAIAPGNPVGTLTVTNGLAINAGGSYTWSLASNTTNSPGVNFDQIVVSGGSLALANNCSLTIAFTNSATAPSTNTLFWQLPHSWKIIALGADASNVGMPGFSSLANGIYFAGQFSASIDAAGDVMLNYSPTPAPMLTSSLPGAGTTNVSIAWSSVAGLTYQVQYSTNLAVGPWVTVGSVPATGTNATFTDNFPPLPTTRFYRVIIPPTQ